MAIVMEKRIETHGMENPVCRHYLLIRFPLSLIFARHRGDLRVRLFLIITHRNPNVAPDPKKGSHFREVQYLDGIGFISNCIFGVFLVYGGIFVYTAIFVGGTMEFTWQEPREDFPWAVSMTSLLGWRVPPLKHVSKVKRVCPGGTCPGLPGLYQFRAVFIERIPSQF